MNKLRESSSARNFTMLSRKMYELFLHYILCGRIRAPPEADLTFLKSTFQKGAKTDRRALQSKFKTWAKRMVVENRKLKLICTGKEIIPIEDSCKIVMRMHFEGHLSVDQVIKQVQNKYTWTKKNFGLDRKTVVDLILKHCNNKDCNRAVKIGEVARNYKCKDFIKAVIHSSESHIQSQMHQSSAATTNLSAMCSWPIGHNSSPSSSDTENRFPSNLETHVKTPNHASNTLNKVSFSKDTSNLGIETEEVITDYKRLLDVESNVKNKSVKLETPLRIPPRSFRKPRNVIDFQTLLSAAEQYADYPAVLYNSKTKFLGSFGLAPKRICSKRTLSRVEKEKKRKKTQCVQNMMYSNQNRRNLRDRNKLKKIKLKDQLGKPAYLDKFRKNFKDEVRMLAPKNTSDNMNDDSYYVGGDESNNVINSVDDNEIEIIEVVEKNNEQEVIEIVSSEDENDCESLETLLMGGKSKAGSVKSDSEKTKTLSSQHLGKASDLKLDQKGGKTTDCVESTEWSTHAETPKRYYPIFTQTYVLPPISKREVVVMPVSQRSLKVPSNQNKPLGCMNSETTKSVSSKNSPFTKSAGPMNNLATISLCSMNSQANKPVCYMNSQANKPVCFINNQVTKSEKLTIDMMQGKKAIQQPISSVMKAKSFNMQTLPNPGIASKIPHGTNVYMVQKEPNGIIKMVPCKNIATAKNTSAQCSKEIPNGEKPISVVNPVNFFGVPTKTKYKSIFPVPNVVEVRNRQNILDAKQSFIDEEMTKLSKWIEGMKSSVARTYFQRNVLKSKQKLESQLNAAIALVKNIRRKLYEIEKLEEKVNYNISPQDAKNFI